MKGFFSFLQTKPVFAIHPATGVAMLRSVAAVLSREMPLSADLFDVRAAVPRTMYARNDDGRVLGKVLSYPLHGTLYAQDHECGPPGMHSHARLIEMVAYDDEFDALVLDIQSPGGQVMGLEDLASAIAAVRAEKPVIAYVNGMAASAGYRLAIEADEIIMSGSSSEVGSIGVMMSFLDYREWLKKEGIRQINIVSNLSPDKNSFFLSDYKEEDIALFRQEDLDPLADSFQQAVISRRPNVPSDVMTGRMYTTAQAIANGLADREGSYLNAIERAAEIVQQRANADNDMKFFTKKNQGATAEDQQPVDQNQTPTPAAEETQPENPELQAEHGGSDSIGIVSQEEFDSFQEDVRQSLQQTRENMVQAMADISETLSQIQNTLLALGQAPADQPVGQASAPNADANATANGGSIGGEWGSYFANKKKRALDI